MLGGGLVALGVGHLEGYYGAAKYVDQALRGKNLADPPIAPPTTLAFQHEPLGAAKHRHH